MNVFKYMIHLCLLFYLVGACADPSPETKKSFWTKTRQTLNQIWSQGKGDLYVPYYAWHNRLTYTSDKLPLYNEMPWGMGVGKGIWDDRNNWQGLYGMVFLDSHKNVQPMGGYGYLITYHPTDDSGLGIGFTAMVTARPDILNNVPFPAALPLASMHYKRLMILGAYVPGGTNIGNVLFMMAKLTLE
jgi:lipid IVA palmitoyltransferase